jgi:hypothetical protein
MASTSALDTGPDGAFDGDADGDADGLVVGPTLGVAGPQVARTSTVVARSAVERKRA